MSAFNISPEARNFIKHEISSRSWFFAVYFLMSVITGALEMVGLALIFPLITVIMSPQTIDHFPVIKEMLGAVGIDTHKKLVGLLVVSIAFVMVIKNVFMGGFYYLQSRVIAKWKTELSRRLMNIYLFSDFRIHMEKTAAEIIRNISLTAIVFDQYVLSLLNLVVNVIVAVGIASVLLISLPEETSLGLVVLITTAGILYLSTRKTFAKIGADSNVLHRERQQLILQSIGAIKESKILGKENYFIDQYCIVENQYFRKQGFQNFLAIIPVLSIETAIIMTMLGFVTYALFVAGQKPEGLAGIAVFAAAMFRLMPITNRILNNLRLMDLGKNSIETIAREINENEHRIQLSGVRPEEKLTGWKELTFQSVDYVYPDGTEALTGVNLTIRRNEFIGITGPSGCGKSTLLMTILGLLEPTGGALLVDGKPLKDPARLRRWQNSIGYVPQTVFLINAPLLNNIAYCEGDVNVDIERVRETIKQVHLEEFVERQPEGIYASVGDYGNRLSGGEKQRVVIARAIYRNPDLLAFDEATASLDAAVERSITNNLMEFLGRKTLVAIAHKLSTIRKCDRIIMMGKGEVIDVGSFDELRDRCEPFRELVEASSLGEDEMATTPER